MDDSELSINILNGICDSLAVLERRASYGEAGRGFRDLRVWQAGMDLVESCYRASQAFPQSEQFGLTNQLRRAAVSITANIAEGWGRNTQPEFGRFVDISIGSLCEVESLIEVSRRLQYISTDTLSVILERANKVGSMLHRLRTSLRR
jgi:four helix bundle protein